MDGYDICQNLCVINGGLTLGLSSGWHNLNGKNVRPINLLQHVDMCQHACDWKVVGDVALITY
jgi:hypothetical protein